MAGRLGLSEADLYAMGAAVGVAAVEAARKAAREEAEAVFEAIIEAAEAASRYLSALYPEVGSASAAAEALEAVQPAAARVSGRVVALVARLYIGAGGWAKSKLDGVNGLVPAGDVASPAAAIVHGIKGFSPSAKFPNHASRQVLLQESPTGGRAVSITAEIVDLLRRISSDDGAAAGEKSGLKVPTKAMVAISVIGVAAELAYAVLLA